MAFPRCNVRIVTFIDIEADESRNVMPTVTGTGVISGMQDCALSFTQAPCESARVQVANIGVERFRAEALTC